MSFGLDVAARTVWGEARGESDEGMRAVAWVIRNRHRSGKWYAGKALAETCLMPAQFSCWNAADKNRKLLLRLPDDDTLLLRCRKYVEEALAGRGEDPTKGSTHYYAVGIKPPPWAISGLLMVQVGGHRFYRNVE